MAFSRFVNVSDEDLSQFLEENENKNTARKTSQDVACNTDVRLARSRYGIKNSCVNKNDIRLLTCRDDKLYLSYDSENTALIRRAQFSVNIYGHFQ